MIDFLQQLAAEKPRKFEETARPFANGDPAFGRELFKAEGCAQCHLLTGKRSKAIGPDLVMTLGNRRTSKEWLRIQLMNPRRHNPNTVMPSYAGLGQNKLNALVAYLDQLGQQRPGARTPAQPKAPAQERQSAGEAREKIPEADTSEEEYQEAQQGPMQAIHIVGAWKHGAVLFQQHCLTCHGPEGHIVAPDFPVPPQGVPVLNPIRQELYAHNPAEFARNIDPFIQHGMPNPSEGPDMPAFGDTHTLTQAQIADIEAYVLRLQGVDRAEIVNPGVEPKAFLCIVLGGSLVMMVLFGGVYWWSIGRAHRQI